VVTYNAENLTKHNVTAIEVDEVLSHPRTIWLDLGPSREGNDR